MTPAKSLPRIVIAGAALLALPMLAACRAETGPTFDAERRPSQAGTITGKERLSDKASDAQRVDDCRVPPEKRDPAHPRADCPEQMQPEG